MNDPTNATRGTSLMNTSRLCVFALLLFVVLAVFFFFFFWGGGGVKTLLLRRVHHNESPKGLVLAPPSWIAVKIGKV